MAGRTARTWSRARDGGRQSGWWKGHLWMAAQLTRCFHKTKKHTTESFHILIYNAAFLPSKTRQPFLQLREATVSMFRKGVLLLCQRRHGGEHPFPCAVCTQRLCTEPQVPAGEAARSGSRLVKAREGSATYVQRSPKGATGAPAHAVPTRLAFSFPPKPAAPGLAVHLVLPSHGLTGAALLLPWPLHMCLFVTMNTALLQEDKGKGSNALLVNASFQHASPKRAYHTLHRYCHKESLCSTKAQNCAPCLWHQKPWLWPDAWQYNAKTALQQTSTPKHSTRTDTTRCPGFPEILLWGSLNVSASLPFPQ